MKRVEWNQVVLAARRERVRDRDTRAGCGWKAAASFDDVVGDAVNRDAAWYDPKTKPEAKRVEGRVAIGKGVVVRDV